MTAAEGRHENGFLRHTRTGNNNFNSSPQHEHRYPTNHCHEQEVNYDSDEPKNHKMKRKRELGKKMVRGYMAGQLLNVVKAGLWWSTFGTLSIALLQGDLAISAARAPFNLALFVSSPFAVATADAYPIRTILLITTIGRFILWGICVPVTWLLLIGHSMKTYWLIMMILVAIDGIQVAFANAVDIDCGGIDTLCSQYAADEIDYTETTTAPHSNTIVEDISHKPLVSHKTRQWYHTLHQIVFDASFVILTPIVLFGLNLVSRRWANLPQFFDRVSEQWTLKPILDDSDTLLDRYVAWDRSTFVLVAGISLVFSLVSWGSVLCYWKFIPSLQVALAEEADGVGDSDSSEQPTLGSNSVGSSAAYSSDYRGCVALSRSTLEKMKEVVEGCEYVRQEHALKWRLIMLSMETSCEDCMVSVVIPMVAVHCHRLLYGPESATNSALTASICIAVGKLGGVMSSAVTSLKNRSNPGGGAASVFTLQSIVDMRKRYRRLFHVVFLSSLSLILLPIGLHLIIDPTSDEAGVYRTVGTLCVLGGIFLFFSLSTATKLGFQSLLNSLVDDEEWGPRIYAFVGLFVTIIDAIMICAIDFLFYWNGPEKLVRSLWILVGLYLAHGLFEAVLGPVLILDRMPVGDFRPTFV